MLHGRRRRPKPTKFKNAHGQIVNAHGNILHARLRNSPQAPGFKDPWGHGGKGKR